MPICCSRASSALKPTVKFRYLKAGFEIVGDHKQAREARQLYDYYQDLVKEIKLVTRIDGPAVVGHEEPFGVFIELLHTPEIERESGGFGRYLQNQNSNMFFSYNYGRPTENYRDKFKETVTAVLEDNFDVVSVTFQADDVNSRASAEYGWRVTPYAYLLLKAHGPQVDKIPMLKMDLDFLDTSGFVVLPIQSTALPIDSAPAMSSRPYDKLAITQTLNSAAQEGKLILEVKATAHGLVPPLDQILDRALRVSRLPMWKTKASPCHASTRIAASQSSSPSASVWSPSKVDRICPSVQRRLRSRRLASTKPRWSTSGTTTPTWPRSTR